MRNPLTESSGVGWSSGNPAPEVSVVIPLFNRVDLLGHTLSSLSVENHPGVRIEVIVVDDESSDGGPELVLAEFPAVRLIRQQHSGAPAARNRGMSAASATAILLLDSDDLVEAGFFAPRLEALHKNPQADAAYGPWDHFSSSSECTGGSIIPRHTPYPIEVLPASQTHTVRLLAGWYIAPQTILWRASTLERVGGQDVALPVNQDVDLLFRALTTGTGLVGCTGPRALIREHEGVRQGVVGTSRHKAEAMLALRCRFAAVLQSADGLGDAGIHALARFCFERWREFRIGFPDVAAGFLELSRELDPDLTLRGRWPLALLSRLVGPVRAVEIRDALKRPP